MKCSWTWEIRIVLSDDEDVYNRSEDNEENTKKIEENDFGSILTN